MFAFSMLNIALCVEVLRGQHVQEQRLHVSVRQGVHAHDRLHMRHAQH